MDSIYICANPYICDNDLILDINIIFLSYNSKQTNYKHYINVISNKIIKIKISCFYNYKIINTEELNNIYFNLKKKSTLSFCKSDLVFENGQK